MKIFYRMGWISATIQTKTAYKNKNYKKGLKKATKAYKRAVSAFGDRHLKTAQTLDNIVVLNMKLDNYEEAEKYAIQALDIMEELRGKEDFSLIDELRNMEVLYRNWGKDEIADEYEERIGKIIDAHPEENKESDKEEKDIEEIESKEITDEQNETEEKSEEEDN